MNSVMMSSASRVVPSSPSTQSRKTFPQSWMLDFSNDHIIQRVEEGWMSFLASDSQYKLQFQFQRNMDDPEGPDDGYILRNAEAKKEGGFYDLKEFFHYRPDLHELLAARGVSIYSQTREWLQSCESLYRTCMSSVLEHCESIDSELGTDLYSRVRSVGPGLHVLRLLHYKEEMKKGNLLGKAHPDRCFLTLHLYESHPGLEILVDSEWKEYTPEKGKILAFPGKKAPKETDQRLQALPHRIVARIDCPVVKRCSMVFFAHTPDENVPESPHVSY